MRSDGEGGYDFFINVGNSFLLTELARKGSGVEKELIKYWFKYGLVICGLGMIQESQSKANQRDTGNNEVNGQVTEPPEQDNLESVSHAMNGLGRVIIPIVRGLYKGP